MNFLQLLSLIFITLSIFFVIKTIFILNKTEKTLKEIRKNNEPTLALMKNIEAIKYARSQGMDAVADYLEAEIK